MLARRSSTRSPGSETRNRLQPLPPRGPDGTTPILRPRGHPMPHLLTLAAATALLFVPGGSRADEDRPLAGVRRVVFLGDSITYSGQYIEDIEAVLRTSQPALRLRVSQPRPAQRDGLGPLRAGSCRGPFPRPDLHERLERVLKQSRPDLVVACYGMNDGIYYPFGAERFEKYQAGMRRLRERAAAAGARVLHVTPPVFDPVPISANTLPAGRDEYRQPYEGYDEVLDRYSGWLLARKADGWDVVDVHGPMKQLSRRGPATRPGLSARRRRRACQRHGALAHRPRDLAALGRPGSWPQRAASAPRRPWPTGRTDWPSWSWSRRSSGS